MGHGDDALAGRFFARLGLPQGALAEGRLLEVGAQSVVPLLHLLRLHDHQDVLVALTRPVLQDSRAPDDGIDVLKSGSVKKLKTYWIGYWKDYNRFIEAESQPVPDTGLVVNYTMRRIMWELDWLIGHLEADPERISLMGGSMGGRGANYLPRAYPEKFSAWLSLSPGIEPQPGDPLFGSSVQWISNSK